MSLVKYEELIETLSKVGTTQREELLKLSKTIKKRCLILLIELHIF